jgi:hypothetical protein
VVSGQWSVKDKDFFESSDLSVGTVLAIEKRLSLEAENAPKMLGKVI